MDGYLKQSTAAQVRWIGPFVDDTDFKTAETALSIANTDIKVSKNGGASANKNSGGGTHDVNGMYAVTWDATDTATVGELKYSVKVAGALQVFGSYVVLEEAIYDALFAASANAWTGAAGSTTLTALADNSITAAKIAATALNGKGDWNIGKTGYALSAAGVQAIWDALTSALTTVGSIGKLLVDNINATISSRSSHSAADVWSSATRLLTAGTNIVLAKGTGVTGFTDLDAAGVRSAVGLASANLDTQLDTIDNFIDTEVNAIKAKTDNLPEGVTKNAILNNFPFFMVDSADGRTGKTGLTVTAERSIDGAAFGACANAVAEVANGVYKINLAAADLNGDTIVLKFTATGADATIIVIKTEV